MEVTEPGEDNVRFRCFLTPGIYSEIMEGEGHFEYRPYLRPMSSMTEKEFKELKDTWEYLKHRPDVCVPSVTSYDWLNAHHFDYRGLIEKDLAVAVTKENNPYEISD